MIESAVRSYFPDKRIERLDTDSVRKKTHLQSVLTDVKSGDVDILLGTQMVAKGLNFTGVELVGIVLADSGLHIPDFRAHERTFSLITQVAGRAGRYSNAGRVIVQTYLPENSAVAHAVKQELEEFYHEELESRKALGFPPKSRMCRIVFRGKDRELTESGCESAAAFLEKMCESDARFRQLEQLGPAECPISRISGSWRYQLILRSASMPVLLAAAHHVRKQLKLHRSIYMEIDVDPVSLM
jgi:primosomal protein N' (replication factor Y)